MAFTFSQKTISLLTASALFFASTATCRQCTNFTVPVDLTAPTANLNITAPRTTVDIVAAILSMTKAGGPTSYVEGMKNTSGSYEIMAQFCEPDSANATSQPWVQVLTHGAGYDRTYWDFAYNNYNYSYVNNALENGYYTFSYDRLGLGQSSHGDPINEIQAPLEMAALRELTTKLRLGQIPQINKPFEDRIIHVGHSAGSAQTFAFSVMYPNETAGIILTGYGANGSFGNLFTLGASWEDAAMNQPLRFGDPDTNALELLAFNPLGQELAEFASPLELDFSKIAKGLNYTPGYITWASVANQQTLFAAAPNFDPAFLVYTENLKQPEAYGEIFAGAPGSSGPPMTSKFTGPVLVVTGENDLPFCGGDCYATQGTPFASIPAAASMQFPGNKNFETIIQPKSGHGLTLHYNATAGYQAIQDYLKKHNLH